MKNIKTVIRKQRLYFDGGFGTVLQNAGLEKGKPPELWNLSHPEKIIELHKQYINAGSNIITTNTFGVNQDKYENYEQLISEAIKCAKQAKEGSETYIAFDIGPTGRMLEPLGDLRFEDAVELFAANVRVAVECGVDCVLIETMNDSYETKAAVLAAKENSNLPIFVTNVYDESGKLMTGADPETMISMLEGLGVDALGLNCSLGPDLMLPLIDRFIKNSSLPLIVNPNAGLPQVKDGNTFYTVTSDEFAGYMKQIAKKGATILGGCCGTTPEYIRKTVVMTKDLPMVEPTVKNTTVISSYTHAVMVEQQPILIGERINPTGKPKLKEALRIGNLNYILNEGIQQADKGVHVLDVNVGLPEIDEVETMQEVVKKLQSVTDLPLQLDSSDPIVLEKAMRIYNGKPMINSVNGKESSMHAIFPLVKKYGGTVIALTMDENGIPETADERIDIALKITKCAKNYGIKKKDIIVDPLCLTISSNQRSAIVTLETVKLLCREGFRTILGVSNVSFGLPQREKINTAFFNSALESGLNCAIMNPFSDRIMDVYYSFRALHDLDTACEEYIAYSLERETIKEISTKTAISLSEAIIKGMKDLALMVASEILENEQPLEVINKYVVPALNRVGKDYEEKTIYLPQLLMSADAASAVFETIKDKMPQSDIDKNKAMILATVKGDIHDIGKNIVKVLLESYGFKVYDLGRDVDPKTVLSAACSTGCRIVGLSALMTTTVPSMEETIKLLHDTLPNVTVVVGGAVLTSEYASMIGADHYCADAMETVRFATDFYLKEI